MEPYMVKQVGRGVFRTAVAATSVMRGGREFVRFTYLEDGGELREGIDIEEVPSRDLGIVVKVPKNSLILEYAVLELRKYADINEHDYFSWEPFGNSLCLPIASNVTIETYEARPRVFRKIVHE